MDRLFYSKEGLASMRRRRQLPGLRRRDIHMQEDLCSVTGNKLSMRDLQWTLGHVARTVEFDGLKTEVMRKKALAQFRMAHENMDLNQILNEMNRAEQLYLAFAGEKGKGKLLKNGSHSGEAKKEEPPSMQLQS
ncbi:unnamed protein product [Amoebophrya sp. A25]|nr:unnamed protein product [Amoebophrya sp. A25]|eukprot:GSA25T00018207001.1